MKNSTEPTLKEQGKETIPDAPEGVGLSIPYTINVWPKYPVNSCSLFPFNFLFWKSRFPFFFPGVSPYPFNVLPKYPASDNPL